MNDEKGWGNRRHRRSCSSVNDCTTSGLAHIGQGRIGGLEWAVLEGTAERGKRGNISLLSLGHAGLLCLWES